MNSRHAVNSLSFVITLSATADLQKRRQVGEGIEDHGFFDRVVRGRRALQSHCRNCDSLTARARKRWLCKVSEGPAASLSGMPYAWFRRKVRHVWVGG